MLNFFRVCKAWWVVYEANVNLALEVASFMRAQVTFDETPDNPGEHVMQFVKEKQKKVS